MGCNNNLTHTTGMFRLTDKGQNDVCKSGSVFGGAAHTQVKVWFKYL